MKILKIISTIIVALLIASVCAGATAIVRTYVNEANIDNIYKALVRIEKKLDTAIK